MMPSFANNIAAPATMRDTFGYVVEFNAIFYRSDLDAFASS
jgi:hypothetical protein